MLSTCCFFHTATCALATVILRVLLLDLLHVFLTPVHSETISIKKFKHYSFVECDDTYFQHIVFSYCYWCTCYSHSKSTTVRLIACLFDSCTFRNNLYQKIQALFICRM